MSNGQLTLEYQKNNVPSVGYFMKTIMKVSGTDPADLYDCLVVNKGDAGTDEVIARVATFIEIFSSPLDLLPNTVNLFSSPSLPGGIAPGDLIHFGAGVGLVMPPIWQHIYGLTSLTVEVATVISPTEVSLVSPCPAFARNIPFQYEKISPPGTTNAVDGLANRDFSGVVGSFFRTQEHGDMWSSFAAADNKYQALRAEAQSLVDAYNEDRYSGDIEETYES